MKSREGSRRDFMGRALCGIGGLTFGGALWSRWLGGEVRAAPFALRPPGARVESAFLATCIKCGQCVQACPYDTLHLAGTSDDVPLGTPFMLPRETPCYLCEDVPCVKACPSGALDPALEDVRETRIGLAALIDQENCLSHQGLRCEICHRECPLIDKAITVTVKPREKSKHAVFVPVVHSDACTGCGICEKVCPLERSAIRIFPVELAQGELGAHYELGGIERQKLLEGEAEAPDPDDALRYLNEEAP